MRELRESKQAVALQVVRARCGMRAGGAWSERRGRPSLDRSLRQGSSQGEGLSTRSYLTHNSLSSINSFHSTRSYITPLASVALRSSTLG